jgi:hypothetical protein
MKLLQHLNIKFNINFNCGFQYSDKSKVEDEMYYQQNGERKTFYKFEYSKKMKVISQINNFTYN